MGVDVLLSTEKIGIAIKGKIDFLEIIWTLFIQTLLDKTFIIVRVKAGLITTSPENNHLRNQIRGRFVRLERKYPKWGRKCHGAEITTGRCLNYVLCEQVLQKVFA